jgi:hypothetical protein
MDWHALATEFRELLEIEPPTESAFKHKVEAILARLSGRRPVSAKERRTRLLALVNSKFDINTLGVNEFLTTAAEKKYHSTIMTKTELQQLSTGQTGLTDFLYQRDREITALARPDPAAAGTG